ncbi:MAG: MFS transporter [Archangiaceae bacterium]|nr:MFS transporter [Archangiaceae bacterium]
MIVRPLEGRSSTAPSLTLYYLLVYGAGGITMPFLPQYLKTLGLTGTEVGLLLSMSPALSLVAPALWGQLTDRTGRPGLVMLAVTTGSATTFAFFLVVKGFGGALAVFFVYACFASANTTLIDSMTLRHVARHGGSFARIRLWGSVGFAVVSLAFGRLVDTIDYRAVVGSFTLLAAGAVWTAIGLAQVTSRVGHGPRPSWNAALGLAQGHEMRVFLIAAAIHWAAGGPYHSALAIHATALKLPTHVVGDAATLGVVSEIAVMVMWPRIARRAHPRTLLFLSFAASGLRWLGVALTTDGTVLVLLSVFHGLTFGVFFLSAVAFMTERVPDSLRASGQALFVASAFGVGSLTGVLGTGVGLDLLPSSNAVFAISAGLEVIACALVLQLPRTSAAR